jgi:hypothetical protein
MESLLHEYLPQAPQHGLYRAPSIPDDKLRAALRDYAPEVDASSVLALYDATRLGSAKDGAVFLADRLVYQNNDLTPAQTIRYEDIVRVNEKRLFLGGRKVELDVNQGRATTTHALDFSGRAEAAEFVARFLQEAMLASARAADTRGDKAQPAPASSGTPGRTAAGSDIEAVEHALADLRTSGALADADYRRLRAALREG